MSDPNLITRGAKGEIATGGKIVTVTVKLFDFDGEQEVAHGEMLMPEGGFYPPVIMANGATFILDTDLLRNGGATYRRCQSRKLSMFGEESEDRLTGMDHDYFKLHTGL